MSNFQSDFAAMIRRAAHRVDTLIMKSGLDMLHSIELKSPVGDADFWLSPPPPGYTGGQFRANWSVSFNAIDDATSQSTEYSSRSQENATKLLQYRRGDTIFICNSLPYAHALEFGLSHQAPAGMVRITAEEFEQYVAAQAQQLND